MSVFTALNSVLASLPPDRTMVVVHGACPQGADWIAHRWVLDHPQVVEDPFPAKWSAVGRRAGILRNREMVEAGADLCFAFGMRCTRCDPNDPHHVTHGTAHCARIAWEAGIHTRHFGTAW
jgi:hypothetical protein